VACHTCFFCEWGPVCLLNTNAVDCDGCVDRKNGQDLITLSNLSKKATGEKDAVTLTCGHKCHMY
jgi:hypothetical protein